MSYSFTCRMLRPTALSKQSQQAFSFPSNLSKALGDSKKQVMCSMSWQILCGTRVPVSARGCTAFWWAHDSFSLLLLIAGLGVRNSGAPFSFRCGKRKMWDVSYLTDSWSLPAVFSLLLGKLILFILREASYILVI